MIKGGMDLEVTPHMGEKLPYVMFFLCLANNNSCAYHALRLSFD